MKRTVFALVVVVVLSSVMLPTANGKITSLFTHVFAKGINKSGSHWAPINATDSFAQDDDFVYAFTSASFGWTNFTWRWYDPTGAVFSTGTAKYECQDVCQLYDSLQIRGSDAAAKLGTWKMDLLADGVKAYTDLFKLVGVAEQEIAWHFDIDSATHARVNMTVNIHPYQEKWDSFSFNIHEQVGNITAHECRSYRILGVSHSQDLSDSSQTDVRVVFDSPQGDGYCLIVSFDLRSALGSRGNDLFLTWTWSNGVHPLPETVAVTLPRGYTFASLEGATGNYTKSFDAGRETLSFAGTAPPDGAFHWTILYAQIPQVTTATQASAGTQPTSVATTPAPQLPWPIMLAFAVVIVVGGVAVLFMKKRKSSK